MDIAGLGPRAIAQLHASGHLLRLTDLYSLEARHARPTATTTTTTTTTTTATTTAGPAAAGVTGGLLVPLLELPGWGDTSVRKLFAAIAASREDVTLARWEGGAREGGRDDE
jgi:NAD-dependent DNA ligase